MRKLTRLEELLALDATLELLEFWAWRAQQDGETAKAQSYSRGYAVFEENKQGLLWSLSKEELAEYEARRKAKKKSAGVTKAPGKKKAARGKKK